MTIGTIVTGVLSIVIGAVGIALAFQFNEVRRADTLQDKLRMIFYASPLIRSGQFFIGGIGFILIGLCMLFATTHIRHP